MDLNGITYRFGTFELQPRRRVLLEGGTPVGLGGRAFDLLVALVEQRHRLVAKDELFGLVWPTTAVEENSLTVAIAAVRKAVGDDAQRQAVIRTVAGRGYQFVAPVDDGAVQVAEDHAVPADPALSTRPSIAVLPLTNMSGDIDQEYFADGISEDIITNLARNRWLTVIARNSSFTYKNRAVDLRDVSRELGVRYVLEGSVRRAGSSVRVTAQLIDATTGAHIWADRYDRALDDVFAVQDDVTGQVTAAIRPAVFEAEQSAIARRPPENLDAWQAYQRGNWHFGKNNADDNRRAQDFYRQAIALDPHFAPSYAGLGLSILDDGWIHATRRLEDVAVSALEIAHQAMSADPLDAQSVDLLALAFLHLGDHQAALENSRQAVALNPHDTDSRATLGAALVFSGRHDEGIAEIGYGLRLNPRGPRRYLALCDSGWAHFLAGRSGEAAAIARRVAALEPRYPSGHRLLAVSAAELGQIAEAQAALRAAMQCARPDFEVYTEKRAPWVRPMDHDRIVGALRKIG